MSGFEKLRYHKVQLNESGVILEEGDKLKIGSRDPVEITGFNFKDGMVELSKRDKDLADLLSVIDIKFVKNQCEKV